MAVINFNAQQVKPQDSFEPIPANWYNVMIDESEIKPTNAADGHYLEMRMTVMDGEYANRKLFGRFNIDNKNQTAVDIAYAQLSSICHAVGVLQVDDTNLLHGKPFQVKVTVRPPQGAYDASNELKAFKACDGNVSSSAASTGGQPKEAPAWAAKKEEPKQEAKQEVKQEESTGKAPWQAKEEPKEEVKQEAHEDTGAGKVEDTPTETGEAVAPWLKKK